MQQLQLKRVANIAIDLYGTTAVLSRSTRALNRDDTSAAHEVKLATAFCDQAQARIRRNIDGIYSSNNGDKLVESIAGM